MDPLRPSGEPDLGPPEGVPESLPATLPRIDGEHDHGIALPDLIVRSCEFYLPPMQPDNIEPLDLPVFERFWQQHFAFAGVKTDVFNQGPGDAGEFDVRFTVAIAELSQETGRFEILRPPVVKLRTIKELRANWVYPLYEALFPIERASERVYIALVEVNPVTDRLPLGKIVERNYANNRCGCTFVDYPEWHRPLGPINLDDPPTFEEPWRISRRMP